VSGTGPPSADPCHTSLQRMPVISQRLYSDLMKSPRGTEALCLCRIDVPRSGMLEVIGTASPHPTQEATRSRANLVGSEGDEACETAIGPLNRISTAAFR